MGLPDCHGTLVPGARMRKSYNFDCTTKPDLGQGWIVTQYYVRGYVNVK
jgi:hypothetical protein